MMTGGTVRLAGALLAAICLLAGTCGAGGGAAAEPGGVPGGLQLVMAAPGGGPEGKPAAEADSLKPPEYYHAKWSPFLRTTLEMVGFNFIMTLYGKHIMKPEDHGFDVDFDSIRENLKNGFEWDDNSFSANNFRHPYQGSLYFGGARANGYDFFEASMFAFAGSWLFEYAGEAHHPSINDWINTAVGGMTIGESLYRLSDMVLDNTATGSGRIWRELGGFAFSPMRGVNRVLTGEAFEVHANPPNRIPGFFGADFRFGLRTLGEKNLWTSKSTKSFFSFDMTYGNPFEVTRGKPFDHFTFGMQVNFANRPHGIGWFESRGMLYAGDVVKTETSHHIFGSFIHFDYIDNEAYTYGGQSLSFSYLSRFRASERFGAVMDFHLQYIILGAAKSDYFSLSGREYDYGPGVGYKFGAHFWLNKYEFLSLWHEGHLVHSINGNKADHFVNLTRVKLDYPVRGFIGIGADYILYMADRYYRDYPDVHAKNPELRLYMVWKTY
jgi:hypothetical protein